MNQHYRQGVIDGKTEGYDEGYQQGYDHGYQQGDTNAATREETIERLWEVAADWCRDVAADFPDVSPLDVLRAVLEAFLAQRVRSGQQQMEAV